MKYGRLLGISPGASLRRVDFGTCTGGPPLLDTLVYLLA